MLINLNTDISGTIKDTIKMNESRQQKLDEMKRNFNMTPEEREENEYNIYIKDLFSDVNFWSTEKLEIYNRLLDAGDMDLLKNIKNPYYDNNTGIRKAKVDFGYTDEEFEEIKKCKADLIYFAEHYCYTMTAEGHKQIKLRPYQKRVLRELYENRFSVFLASRQIGKTTMSTIFLTWFVLFNHSKNVLVLANKGETMTEILGKIKEIYLNLPYFLQCGVNRWGETFIRFENKCRIIGQATTKSPGVGYTIHFLYIDEFAHIHKNIIEPFYENVLPVLSAPELYGVARFIITSTSNGMNKFSEIYTDAVAGRNSFHAIRVDWWEVEGRDEEWRLKTIADSSLESFNRQFGNQFISESNLLMNNPKIPKTWNRFCKEYVRKDLSETLSELPEELQKHFYWHPDFDVDSLQDGFFVISLDFADGEGGDYNVMNIFQVQTLSDVKMRKGVKKFSLKDYIRLVQVGYYRDNYTTMPNFSLIFSEFIYNCVNLDRVKVIFEVNDNRYLLLYSDLSRNKMYFDGFLYRSYHTEKARQKKIGLKLNTQSRHSNFITFKNYLLESNIVITDKVAATEMMNFCVSKNGTYQSMGSNDDVAMSSFNISNFFDDDDYAELIEDYISELGPEFEVRVMNLIDRNIDELDVGETDDVSDLIKDLDF